MAAAIETKIWLALRTRVETLVLSPQLEIAWPNETFTPVTGTPFLEVKHFPNVPQRKFLKGSEPNYFQGILQIMLHAQQNRPYGHAQAVDVAGQIIEHFPADQLLPYDNITARVAKKPYYTIVGNTGVYYDISISIPYHLED